MKEGKNPLTTKNLNSTPKKKFQLNNLFIKSNKNGLTIYCLLVEFHLLRIHLKKLKFLFPINFLLYSSGLLITVKINSTVEFTYVQRLLFWY
ncbi:hypothetical protein BpHYR1_004956 [Brachionus plicatilis]|uniref:Uncharacterized protein n=1 Tax=Brachionus plicatilis TaxID=10195 RepID=A0A3M7RJK2_BRAPC|nr:hypothetical protein BpHYR1_004956 [Brachionus plicatilis]